MARLGVRERAHQDLALDLNVHNRKKSAINPSLIQWVRSFVREKASKPIVGSLFYLQIKQIRKAPNVRVGGLVSNTSAVD